MEACYTYSCLFFSLTCGGLRFCDDTYNQLELLAPSTELIN
jgi:hypothetical protein